MSSAVLENKNHKIWTTNSWTRLKFESHALQSQGPVQVEHPFGQTIQDGELRKKPCIYEIQIEPKHMLLLVGYKVGKFLKIEYESMHINCNMFAKHN